MAEIIRLWRQDGPHDHIKITRKGRLAYAEGNGKPVGVCEEMPIESINHATLPRLSTALDAWMEVTEGEGIFNFGTQAGTLIMDDERLLTPRTSVLVVNGDHPLDFIFLWYPRTLDIYGNEDFILRPLRDSARDNILIAAAETMGDVIEQRRPLLHQLRGTCDGMLLAYHRLLLPCVDNSGDVVRIVTISEDLFRDKW